jgi:hypothetical protein
MQPRCFVPPRFYVDCKSLNRCMPRRRSRKRSRGGQARPPPHHLPGAGKPGSEIAAGSPRAGIDLIGRQINQKCLSGVQDRPDHRSWTKRMSERIEPGSTPSSSPHIRLTSISQHLTMSWDVGSRSMRQRGPGPPKCLPTKRPSASRFNAPRRPGSSTSWGLQEDLAASSITSTRPSLTGGLPPEVLSTWT